MLLVKKLFVKILVSFFLSGFLFAQKKTVITLRKGFVSQIGYIRLFDNSTSERKETKKTIQLSIFENRDIFKTPNDFNSWLTKRNGISNFLRNTDSRIAYNGMNSGMLKVLNKESRWMQDQFKNRDFNVKFIFTF